MGFSEFVKNLRVTLGYSMNDLGELLGVTRGAIFKWEHGTARPSFDHQLKFNKLCIKHGIDINWDEDE